MTHRWPISRLGDHVDLLAGYAFKSAEFTKSPDDIRLLRGANIGQGELKWDQERRWPKRDVGSCNKFLLAADDVVIAMDRPWIEAGLKWAPIVAAELPMLLVQRVARLRPLATLDRNFLRCLIASPRFSAYIKAIVTGVNVPHISPSQIRSFEFPLLGPGFQRAAGMAIRAFDDLIENNRRRIEILEEMARLLYREWFAHFRFPGHEDVELVDSELGPIPEGWEVARTSELISIGELEIGDGYRAKNVEMIGGPLRFLRVKNVREGYFSALDEADSFPSDYADVVGHKCSRAGDIAIAMKGSVGRLARVDESTPPLVYSPQTSYWRVNGSGQLSSTFLYEWMQSPSFIQQCAQVKGATDMADYVNLKDQRSMRLALPPTRLVRRFGDRVDPQLDLASNLRQQNRVLREARDLLLPRLVSGELDVSELDLDGVLA